MLAREQIATPTGTVRRALVDAEKAAREGNAQRAYGLLDLAINLASPGGVPVVLLAAQSVRDALESQGLGAPMIRRDGVRSSVAVAVPEAVDVGPLGYPTPRFPTSPPPLDKTFSAYSMPGWGSTEASQRGVELRNAPQGKSPRKTERRERRSGLTPALLVALIVAGSYSYWSDLRPAIAGTLTQVSALFSGRVGSDAGSALATGRSLLAQGDSAAAIAEWMRAAEQDRAGSGVAWEVAESLARMPGLDSLAAEAYLLAFTAGLPQERWRRVADAQDRIGHHVEAERIRGMKP